MGNSEPYKLGVAKLQADTQAATLLGTPIKAGYPRGSMDMQGQSGKASYNFSVTGRKASGQVSLRATRDFDQWTVNSLKLKIDGQNSIVDIVAPGSVPVRLHGYRLTSPGDDAVKTSFTTADKKITLAIAYRRPVEGTRVVADWIKTDAGGKEPDRVESEVTIDAAAMKRNQLTFDLKSNSGLPAGNYHVDVLVDGALAKSMPFEVVKK